jgi:methyl-accepting chemotaxis protein
MRTQTLALVFGMAVAVAGDLRAQFGESDGPDKIKQIVKEVAEQMQEIDRMLLRSTSPDKGAAEAAKGLARSVEKIDELLEQTTKTQTEVVRGIDDLITEIEKMRGSGT